MHNINKKRAVIKRVILNLLLSYYCLNFIILFSKNFVIEHLLLLPFFVYFPT